MADKQAPTDAEIARLAGEVVAQLRAKKLKIATAESCTGGLVAAAITDLAGASDVFHGGFIPYSNEAKSKMIRVEARMIRDYGAVSSQVARAMAEGAHSTARSNYAIAITGIAGPDGGSAKKPVGLVYIACANDDKTNVVEKQFGPLSRDEIRRKSVEAALQLVLETLAEKDQ